MRTTVVWKSCTMTLGAQSAATIGTYKMRKWSVGCLVLRVLGQLSVADFMDMARVRYGWIVSNVPGAKAPWRNVHIAAGATTMMCVVTTAMLECIVYLIQ